MWKKITDDARLFLPRNPALIDGNTYAEPSILRHSALFASERGTDVPSRERLGHSQGPVPQES